MDSFVKRNTKGSPAWLWALVNQFAFPGLGTIMMGRRVGYVQATIMLAGFFLTTGFLLWYLFCAARYATHPAWTEADFVSCYRGYRWSLYLGLALCAVAWIWALFSSIDLLRQARSAATEKTQSSPE